VEPPEITRLLMAARAGDVRARDELFREVYDELHRIARHILAGERAEHTLSTTAVVHEAYLRLAGGAGIPGQDRDHFFAVAARAMRHLLVDHARRRLAAKRDALAALPPVIVADDGGSSRLVDIVAVDRALERLADIDGRLARVVELRFFTGLSTEEIGDVLGVTARTVKRDWRKARAFLARLLEEGDAAGPDGS